jgi:hypothetical protein
MSMRNRIASVVVTIGLIAATLGNALLLVSCASERTVRRESAYLLAATTADMETTFAVVRRGGAEANPVMKPFVDRGRPATYALQLAIDGALIWYAMRLKERGDPRWHWPLRIVAFGHLGAATWNATQIRKAEKDKDR